MALLSCLYDGLELKI